MNNVVLTAEERYTIREVSSYPDAYEIIQGVLRSARSRLHVIEKIKVRSMSLKDVPIDSEVAGHSGTYQRVAKKQISITKNCTSIRLYSATDHIISGGEETVVSVREILRSPGCTYMPVKDVPFGALVWWRTYDGSSEYVRIVRRTTTPEEISIVVRNQNGLETAHTFQSDEEIPVVPDV